MSVRSLILASLTGLLVLAGCADEGSTGSVGSLTMDEAPDGVSGLYEAADGDLQFTSQFVEEHVLDIVIEMNGMMVTALLDFESGVIEYDGYGVDTGDDTQMLDEDRALLLAFSHALDELGTEVPEHTAKLRDFASIWSEFPTSLEMQRVAIADMGRSVVCLATNQYHRATHDDWDYDRWDDASTLDNVYVSSHGDLCNGAFDGSAFYSNAGGYDAWWCYEPDHKSNVEYGYGNCFGRCGGGCGGGDTFSRDCLDHDECVRTGHGVASSWCSDELASVADDLFGC